MIVALSRITHPDNFSAGERKQQDFFLKIISIFSVNGQTGIVQLISVFLLLSSKTNAYIIGLGD